MLNEHDIISLGTIISDSINKRIKNDDAKKRLNAILHNKSIKTVMKELDNYVKSIHGNAKNKAVLIAIMSLLRRDLDCEKELSSLILKHKLLGSLYGGLKVLFSGDSESFSLGKEIDDSHFKNKYELITRFPEFNYWDYIIVFCSVNILCGIAPEIFEKLALEDNSKLILLNMVTHHLNVRPSDGLTLRLLQSDDELKQNIGMYFLTEDVTRAIKDIYQIKYNKEDGLPIYKKLKNVKEKFNLEITKCCSILGKCKTETTAELLFNYWLVHQNHYPKVFAKMLMSSRFQDEFSKQIKETYKIKTLKDVYVLTSLIDETPALNKNKKRISKKKLYTSVMDVLISFIEEERGIYGWDKQQEFYVKEICEKLPPNNVSKFKLYLKKKRKTLMCSKIDELVRFKIYLKDKRKQQIIDGISSIIEAGV